MFRDVLKRHDDKMGILQQHTCFFFPRHKCVISYNYLNDNLTLLQVYEYCLRRGGKKTHKLNNQLLLLLSILENLVDFVPVNIGLTHFEKVWKKVLVLWMKTDTCGAYIQSRKPLKLQNSWRALIHPGNQMAFYSDSSSVMGKIQAYF